MFRALFTAQKLLNQPVLRTILHKPPLSQLISPSGAHFSSLVVPQNGGPTLLQNPRLPTISEIVTRSITYFTMAKGKRTTCKDVLLRFYRLNWGGWIRCRAGRSRRLWQKSPPRKRRLRQHVLCNSTQSTLLDKMVGPYWKKPKYWVDDPYEPYHTREEFRQTYTKPRPYFPPEK